jgi:hypothetical protein
LDKVLRDPGLLRQAHVTLDGSCQVTLDVGLEGCRPEPGQVVG